MLLPIIVLSWVGMQPAPIFAQGALPEGHFMRPSEAASAICAAQAVETPGEVASLDEQKKALSAAQKLFGKKQYEQMREALGPLTESEYSEIKWPAIFWTARARYQEGAYLVTMPLMIQVARSYEPLAAQAKYWLGWCWIRKRRLETARACFAQACEMASEDFRDDCAYYVAYTHYMAGHHGKAAELFGEFVLGYPDSGLAPSAQRLLERSERRLQQARKTDFEWVASLGLASTNQTLRWGESPELGLGANARLGGRLNWSPRDDTRVSARAYATRTSYVAGDMSDCQGMVAGLSVRHDLGNTRTASYGLNYYENQRVDIVTSDSNTLGVYGWYATPIWDDGRVAVGLNLSRLEYVRESSSGSQKTPWVSYSEPLSRSTEITVGGSFTDSNVGAAYLSYSGPSVSGSVTRRLSKRRSVRAGISYTARNFDAPRKGQTVARADRQRYYYGEYTQRMTKKIRVTVGWRESSRTSTSKWLNKSDPSWYLRTSQLLDFKF